jgi:hypothetical protein
MRRPCLQPATRPRLQETCKEAAAPASMRQEGAAYLSSAINDTRAGEEMRARGRGARAGALGMER